MKRRLLLALAASASISLAPAPAAAQPASAQAQRDWSQTVSPTVEGGFRMGNPDAPIQLVEFVSLTCPHCRHFAETGAPHLVRDYVRTGRVSFEIRPFPLDIVAAVAAQLNRCAAPARAFALNDAILTGQDQWFARLEALPEEEVNRIDALPPAEQRQRIVSLIGLGEIAARHGLGSDRTRACLADQAGADRIDLIKASGDGLGVEATPSFTINGRLMRGVHDWAALEPLLRPPGR